MNIILAGLGLGSVAFGAWFDQYRYFLYLLTFTLLGVSFYRMHQGKGGVNQKTRVILWTVAAISVSLTLMSIIKNLKS